MFDDADHQIDGYAGQRTVHIGIDLDAPLYTKIYSSFCRGVVHSAGYNAALGDYGNVIVVEHDLGSFANGTARRLWALYGHLDDKSVVGMHPGKRVKRGECLGRMGDILMKMEDGESHTYIFSSRSFRRRCMTCRELCRSTIDPERCCTILIHDSSWGHSIDCIYSCRDPSIVLLDNTWQRW
jgi:Peptidase family M23